MTRLLQALALVGSLLISPAQIAPKVAGDSFDSWLPAGDPTLFSREGGDVVVNWDSARPNSYCYVPLGFTVTPAEDFKVTLVFHLDSLAVGTTPGKLDTFEIAAGLINLTNALDPGLFRGAGIDPLHGARNLVEFDYFPAAGFITATVASTIATAGNQILYSHNYPMPLDLGVVYKIEMSFTAQDRTLRSVLWRQDGSGLFGDPGTELKPLVFGTNYPDFAVDALALINYSDAGQNPPQFSGSLQGRGVFQAARLTLYDRPAMSIERRGNALEIRFETNTGWTYQLESRVGNGAWQPIGPAVTGTGQPATVELAMSEPPSSNAATLFRVSAQRL